MKTLNLFLSILVCATNASFAQGTLVFDQESSNDEVSLFTGVRIQFYGTVGQSFTPSLSTVGFVQLRHFDISPGNLVGATLVVNLRSNAINGPIIGTTTPVSLADSFTGLVNYFFASAVAVVPNTAYYLQAVVQSGDNWGIVTIGDTYPNGVFHGGLTAFSGNDLWFREGIVVPEPALGAIFFLGGGLVAMFVKRRRN